MMRLELYLGRGRWSCEKSLWMERALAPEPGRTSMRPGGGEILFRKPEEAWRFFFARRNRSQSGYRHGSQKRPDPRGASGPGGKFGGVFHVDGAPDTSWSPWRKSNPVADVVYAFADAIDPAEAERTIHRLWPRDARPSGISLVEADPQFLSVGMMLLEPCAPCGWRWEEQRLRRHTAGLSLNKITLTRGHRRRRSPECGGFFFVLHAPAWHAAWY